MQAINLPLGGMALAFTAGGLLSDCQCVPLSNVTTSRLLETAVTAISSLHVGKIAKRQNLSRATNNKIIHDHQHLEGT